MGSISDSLSLKEGLVRGRDKGQFLNNLNHTPKAHSSGSLVLRRLAQRARTVVSGLENSARHGLRHQSTLNVEDQVRVLVDLATDPASLGRHWCGLTLWV